MYRLGSHQYSLSSSGASDEAKCASREAHSLYEELLGGRLICLLADTCSYAVCRSSSNTLQLTPSTTRWCITINSLPLLCSPAVLIYTTLTISPLSIFKLL